jgi:hypothetical protein
MASLVVRRLSEATKERLRQRAALETAVPSAEAERFPDWFIRMTRPGINLDESIAENRTRKGS